jgi:hypothetical protein
VREKKGHEIERKQDYKDMHALSGQNQRWKSLIIIEVIGTRGGN